jgi:hypothetical protein
VRTITDVLNNLVVCTANVHTYRSQTARYLSVKYAQLLWYQNIFNVRVSQELHHKRFKYLHDSILITILGENLDSLIGCQVASYKP